MASLVSYQLTLIIASVFLDCYKDIFLSQFFQIHPDNPQLRLIKQAAEIARQGGLIVVPTDCAYALICRLGDKKVMNRVCQLRQLDPHHNFTILCRDFSELSTYAKVTNSQYRLLKAHTPGAFTFILPATKEVPKLVQHPKKKTIGIRVPNNIILQDLLNELDQAVMVTTLIMPNDDLPLTDPYDIRQTLEHHVDCVIDGGYCGYDVTTVVDMMEEIPQIVRQGLGDASELSD